MVTITREDSVHVGMHGRTPMGTIMEDAEIHGAKFKLFCKCNNNARLLK